MGIVRVGDRVRIQRSCYQKSTRMGTVTRIDKDGIALVRWDDFMSEWWYVLDDLQVVQREQIKAEI